jgi:hypothetical protein
MLDAGTVELLLTGHAHELWHLAVCKSVGIDPRRARVP